MKLYLRRTLVRLDCVLSFIEVIVDGDNTVNGDKKYYSLQSDCKNCPLRKTCISDKAKTKKVQHSIYKAELERAKARQQTVKARVMKRKRSSTVEPVWGTLINFTGMKRLNARGIKAANKMLLLAATVYNLKKWLKYTAPKSGIKAMALVKTKEGACIWFLKNILLQLILSPIAALNFLQLSIGFVKTKKHIPSISL